MKQRTFFWLLFSFLFSSSVNAQVRPNTIQKPLLKTTTPNSQALPSNQNTSAQGNTIFYNLNILTPVNQKAEGVAEFTYKGGDYNETTKKLFIHGCANLSGFPCIPGPCACTAGITVKILDSVHTKFKVDVIVNFDKNYYKDDPFVDVSKIPAGNNYYYSASGPDAYINPISASYKKTPIVWSAPTGAAGVQKLTLLIKQKADGTAFTNADFKNIDVSLVADYAFELRSIVVTPL